MKNKSQVRAALSSAVISLGILAAGPTMAQSPALVDIKTTQLTDRPIPRFMVDAAWPKVPEDLIFGQVPGLALDSKDNVWILQRPNSLRFSDTGLDSGMAVCCKAAPHVMQFAPDGSYLQGWGGRSLTAQWPSTVHGLTIDAADTLWIGGNGNGDHVVVNLSSDGSFIKAIGQRGKTAGNFDTAALGNPADVAIVPETGEVLVADGYINKRIIGFAGDDMAYSRMWGAYADRPDGDTRGGAFDQSQASSNRDGGANPQSKSFGDIVHCIEIGPDDLIYVCDRRNNRVQVFKTGTDGQAVFVRDIVVAPGTGGTRSASDIDWSPDGTYMYIADMMNGQVWILDAASYEFLGAFGRNGRYPGQFTWLHSVVVDSKGDVYTSEVGTGRRVQKFVMVGVE